MDVAILLQIHGVRICEYNDFCVGCACFLSIEIWNIQCRTCLPPISSDVSLNQFRLLSNHSQFQLKRRFLDYHGTVVHPWDILVN